MDIARKVPAATPGIPLILNDLRKLLRSLKIKNTRTVIPMKKARQKTVSHIVVVTILMPRPPMLQHRGAAAVIRIERL